MGVESDRAQVLARAFVARWYRETGEAPAFGVSDRMQFGYEAGYLRGRSDAQLLHEARKKKVNDETK
jgi:hypothetical protein